MKLHWILLAVIALLCSSVMVSVIGLVAKKGVPISAILFGVFAVGMVCYGIQTAVTTQFKLAVTPQVLVLLLIAGACSFVANWALFQSTTTAPNPGLAMAIFSLQSGIIALIAFAFFKDRMTALQVAGLLVSLVGVVVMSLGSAPPR